MPLPDASRMLSLDPRIWRAFGERLTAIGVNADALEALAQPLRNIPLEQRGPMRTWHARRRTDPAAHAIRMLMFGDPVTESEARGALGESFDPLRDAGLLEARDERWVSPFRLNRYDDLYVLVDELRHGGDAAMGSGATTTALARATMSTTRIGRALDVGCGAGTLSLLLAKTADAVVGTDISARAIDLARVNARINGVTNIEFRLGDLFAPVSGERFDLIVSQPPFVPAPASDAGATYLYGGARGDELSLRLIAGAPEHLAPGGRCVLYVEWTEVDDEPIERRLRAKVASREVSVLVVRCPPTDLDMYCTWFAATEHPELGQAFEDAARVKRDHLEATGIRSIRATFTVLHRTARPTGWTAAIGVRPMGTLSMTSRRVDRLLAAQDLLDSGDRAILAAHLEVPKRTTFTEERTDPDPKSPAKVWVRFSENALMPPLGVTREALQYAALVASSPTVSSAAEMLAMALGVPLATATVRLLPHVRQALAHGLLQVV